MEWDHCEERGRWSRFGSDLLLLATSLGWTSYWIASWVAGSLCLAARSSRGGRDEDGDDL